jgi:hypothetical protein
MPDIRCPQCGERYPAGAPTSYCRRCGSDLPRQVPASSDVIPPPAMAAPLSPALCAAPRAVAPTIALAACMGGVASMVGWILLLVGVPLFALFGANTAPRDAWIWHGDITHTPGRLQAVESTWLTTNNRSEHHRTFRYGFTFADGGTERQAVSFGYEPGNLAPGATVDVEYPAGRPELARIVGMGRGMVPWFVGAITMLQPAVGLVLVLTGLPGAARKVRLLREGAEAPGRLVAKRPTCSNVNNRRVYRLTYAFRGKDGIEHQARASSHWTELQDESRAVRVLYDPYQPSRACVVDALPGPVRVGPMGELVAPSSGRTALLLLAPIAAALGYVIVLCIHFLK